MNENILTPPVDLLPCPNCGWSEADEQGFLEHQQNLPELPRWKRILRRIESGPVTLADCYYFFVVFTLSQFFLQAVAAEFGIHIVWAFHEYLLIPSLVVVPVIISRFLYQLLSDYLMRKELDHAFQ
ncbi:MAG: hypothetical protein ACTFAL_00170 [Candidatus Electronema sp. V4]|uniref:hypothetical protein n=1 Tax=Candidatus Electronema sp. V4 TaxID=3454756 RepID=UPI00405536B0